MARSAVMGLADGGSQSRDYTTFSPKLAPAATALGGLLVVLAGLGNWLRVAQSARIGDPPQDIAAVMGYSDPAGWAVAAVGLVLMVAAGAWYLEGWTVKLVPILGSTFVVVLAVWRLSVLDATAARLALEAESRLGFAEFHVHFGWGAWSLMIAAVILSLASLIGALREIDVRGGRG